MFRFIAKFFFILAIIVLIGTGYFRIVSAATFGSLDRGLVGHWTLDDANVAGTSVKDVSAYHNHGISTGSPTSQAGAPGMGQSRLFAAGKYVTIPDKGWLNFVNKPFTVSLWVYQTGFISTGVSDYRRLYDKTQAGTGNGYGFDVDGGLLRVLPGGTTVSFPHSLNTWYHIVVTTADSVNATIYINGVSQGSISLTNNLAWLGPAHIACDSDAGSSFPGRIDDVRVYNRMLSASEVKRLMTAGVTRASASTVGKGGSLASDLVAHWTFDGADVTATQVSDRGPSNYYFTRYGNSSPVAGKLGQALKMRSSTTYLQSPSFNFASNTSTISFWAECFSGGGSTYKSIFLKFQDGNNRVDIGFAPACTTIWPVFSNGTGNTGGALYTSSITANHWHLYTFVVDALAIKFYIDGVLQKNISYSAVLTGIAANLIIGTRGGSEFFDGLVDDVRVYNRALASSEVKQLYAMGAGMVANAQAPTIKSYVAGGLKTGLVGHWTFDGMDTTATTILDKSVNGNNGTRNGSTSVVAGKLGQAIKFVGNGYVLTGGSPASGSASFFAWIKPSFLGQCPGTDSPNSCLIGIISGNFIFEAGVNNLSVYGYNFNSPQWVNTAADLPLNAWRHVGFTYDQTYLRVYVNGVIKSTTNTPGTMGSGGGIGIGGGNNFRMFMGVIDDVRSYNRALSATEVKQLYAMGN